MHSDQMRKDGISEPMIQALYYDFVANYVKTRMYSTSSLLLHYIALGPQGRTGQRENTETVAKLPQPAQPRYHAWGAHPEDHVITNN